jgi:hypothetical protein
MLLPPSYAAATFKTPTVNFRKTIATHVPREQIAVYTSNCCRLQCSAAAARALRCMHWLHCLHKVAHMRKQANGAIHTMQQKYVKLKHM